MGKPKGMERKWKIYGSCSGKSYNKFVMFLSSLLAIVVVLLLLL